MAQGDNWYFSRHYIENQSPSRLDGIDLKKEMYLRRSSCKFLRDLGMRLKVRQVTIATATVFFHRFYLRQSHLKNDRYTVATCCLFLAAKVDDNPVPLKEVIRKSYQIQHGDSQDALRRKHRVYMEHKERVEVGELLVLKTLGFDLELDLPYKPLVRAIRRFKINQKGLPRVAWNFVNDSLCTSLCLQFQAHHIAAGAISLASKFLKVKLPTGGEKAWWEELEVSLRQLEEVSNQLLEVYEYKKIE